MLQEKAVWPLAAEDAQEKLGLQDGLFKPVLKSSWSSKTPKEIKNSVSLET